MSGRIDLAADTGWADALGAATGPVVTGVVRGPIAPPRLAMLRATVACVAAERAPAVRINAVVAGPNATAHGVAAAVTFLETAVATTGQTLEIG